MSPSLNKVDYYYDDDDNDDDDDDDDDDYYCYYWFQFSPNRRHLDDLNRPYVQA